MVFLPLLIVLTILATLGLGYLLAALTVFYRDFRYVVAVPDPDPDVPQPGDLPAQHAAAALPAVLLALNPMFGIIEAYRSAILGTPWNLPTLAISTASTLALFVLGLFYFRKTERRFADFA